MVCLVELICVGNELLIGKTLNTNAHWLSRRITSVGCTVRRANIVRDELGEISSSIREALARKPNFIIMTGGLGPTFDDMTLEGVSIALDKPLEMDEEALTMLKERYAEFSRKGRIKDMTLTEYRLKMARLPRGSRPLNNPVGTAPGVLIEKESTTIVALPGVPSEMEKIFEESIIPLLKDKSGNVIYVEMSVKVKEIPESEMAAMIDAVMQNHPSIYIKSHPIGAESEINIELHLSTNSLSRETAEKETQQTIDEISALIFKRGGKIE